MKNKTTRSFARLYAYFRNGREAAVHMGVPPARAKTEGEQLASTASVKRAVKKLDDTSDHNLSDIRAGLVRLAFGSINDAVALIFSDQPTPYAVAHADLFNVSEIKRVKGGGVEVKFFDRQKALEKLLELDEQLKSDSKAEDLINSICQSSHEDISHLIADNDEEEDDDDEDNDDYDD